MIRMVSLYMLKQWRDNKKFWLFESYCNREKITVVFKLSSYFYNFADLRPSHVLALFDKLVSPSLCYCNEVWDFCKDE